MENLKRPPTYNDIRVNCMLEKTGAIKTIYVIILAVIITGAAVGLGTYFVTRPPPSANALTIYTWWTSGGESAAINALVGVFQSQYPNVTVIQSPVAGGAGYVFRSVIKPLVLAGEAPDAFQVHAGYEMQPYVDGGYLDQINDLWSSQNWANVFPSVIKAMVQGADGNYYAVPVDIHRPNVVWYNKPILTANGINASSITSWQDFFAACDKLNQNTTLTSLPTWSSPIALGDTDGWEATHVLEQILVGEGIGFYQDFINGKVRDATNATLVDALTTLAKYLNYTNANHASLTWDEATALVIGGNCAFNVMGDWANGEFEVANKIYGVDYGTFAVPNTSNMYGLVVDCFEHPKGVKDPTNSLNWLKVVGSTVGQNAFNPLKGSIPARTDAAAANPSAYANLPYQLAAMADFQTATYTYPSTVHGSAMPQSFTSALPTILTTFVTNSRGKNSASAISAAATAITQAVTASSSDFVKTWQLT
jgi:glucose/mannose transport system substrate-binding protein